MVMMISNQGDCWNIMMTQETGTTCTGNPTRSFVGGGCPVEIEAVAVTQKEDKVTIRKVGFLSDELTKIMGIVMTNRK